MLKQLRHKQFRTMEQVILTTSFFYWYAMLSDNAVPNGNDIENKDKRPCNIHE